MIELGPLAAEYSKCLGNLGFVRETTLFNDLHCVLEHIIIENAVNNAVAALYYSTASDSDQRHVFCFFCWEYNTFASRYVLLKWNQFLFNSSISFTGSFYIVMIAKYFLKNS